MHIHVPDGVFPPWIWLGSIVLLVPLLALALFLVRKDQKKLVATSAISALMLIVFSIEVFGYHLNFTTLSGILLGPWWSLISITVVNIFLALFGHGGVTVAPINIIVNWVESIIGFLIFSTLIRRLKNDSIKSAFSGIIVLVAIGVSFAFFLGIVYLSGINPGAQLESEDITDASSAQGFIPLKEFAIISAIPTAIGALIEAALTMLVIRFILRTKKELLS